MNAAALAIILVLVVVLVAVGILIVKRSGHPSPSPVGPPSPSPVGPPVPRGKDVSVYVYADPAAFYTALSGGLRTVDGSTPTEKGFDTAADLAKYPLTYAAGHPFYKFGAVGALTGGSWSAAVSRYDQAQHVSAPPSFGKVLLVENKNTGQQPPGDMAYPVILDSDLAVEGVVVRHGGVLLVSGGVKLQTQFVLVESGGLFQAGYGDGGTYRYDGDFQLSLVGGDPASSDVPSYAKMGYPASQYSYEVYAPGVASDCQLQAPGGKSAPAFTPFTGMTGVWNNSFGPKCVCGGFNGDLHLAGAAGPLIPYAGTWDVRDASTKKPWLPDHPLSAGSAELSASYHALWGRLAEGSYPKGSMTLKLDPRDFGADAGALSGAWKAGKQLVVTNCPPQFNSAKDPTGLLPLWLDHPAGSQNHTDNHRANASYFAGKPSADFGLEVCEIGQISSSGGGPIEITLKRPLVFQHDSAVQGMSRGRDKIEVECLLHVALLSRNVRIVGVTGDGDGDGCNVEWKPKTAAAWNPARTNRPAAKVLAASGAPQDFLAQGELEATAGAAQGGIVCNSSGSFQSGSQTDISKACYDMSKQPPDPTEFCGSEKIPPGSSLKGSWVYGTADKSQCNSLLGGQTLFRYGAAVSLDAVELKTMGIAANFGSIAQYAVHFHLTGYGNSFTGYLRDTKHPRGLVVANCSNWLAFSRWFTLHGAMEARLSNNVGLLCFGSGYFVEDGTELLNVIEHNMAIYTQPAVPTPYLNTIPIMANVSSDYGAMAAFWLKDASNTLARNVGCCSPAPVAMIWNVPQPVAFLRGPSAPVLGSKKLGLPAICPGLTGTGGTGGGEHAWTSQAATGNGGGAVMNTCAKADAFSGCFFPEGFPFPLVGAGCPQYNVDNTRIAPRGFAENVSYCIYMHYSEFPEQISTYGVNAYSTYSSPYMGPGFEIALAGKPAALWMPYNGQNACTDRIIGIYPEPIWDPALDEQPVADGGSAYKCSTWTQAATERLLPKIMTGILCFCLGPFQDNNGGAIWVHEDHPWLLNCAFVDPTDRQPQSGQLVSTHGYSGADYKVLGTIPADTKVQTTVNTEVGSPTQSGGACYPVFRNLIINGNVFCPQSPVLWLGDRTFVADAAVWGMAGGEYSGAVNKAYNYFCDFGGKKPADIFPKIPLDPGFSKLFSQPGHATLMSFADLAHPASDGSCPVYVLNVKSGSSCLALATQSYRPPPSSDKTFTKYPFICGDATGLRALSSGVGSAVSFIASQFDTDNSKPIGEQVCTQLFKIFPFMGTDGGVDALVPDDCKSPPPAWSSSPQGPWTVAQAC